MRTTLGVWLRRSGLAALILVLTLAAAGVIYQAFGRRADRRAFPPPGRLVDVGGFRLHLVCTGEGGPTVILETLAGGSLVNWAWIQPELAQRVRVCSYDRAGFGWSDPDPEPASLARTVRNLRTLLDNAGIDGPYILVGHSIGGLYVRQFAEQWPDQVAGLVLLDASHPDQFDRHPELLAATESFRRQSAIFPWLARLGVFRLFFALGGEIDFQDLPARQHDELAAFWSSPAYWMRQRDAVRSELAVFRAAQALGDLDSLPLTVISAGAGTPAGWAELQAELATLSSRSAHVTIPEATHGSLAFNSEHARQVSAAILERVEVMKP